MGFRRRDWKCLAAFAVGLPVAVVGVSDAAAQVPVSYDGVDISNDGNIVVLLSPWPRCHRTAMVGLTCTFWIAAIGLHPSQRVSEWSQRQRGEQGS